MRRKLTKEEKILILQLLNKDAKKQFANVNIDDIEAEPMQDGGMGSIILWPKGLEKGERKMGNAIAELQFKDKDGVLVSAALNIDKEGHLFELDIWKTDFSRLMQIPNNE